ncbi:TIGR02285 family protein [Uliginosibacterium gangwonense]|uniref:TIGR02285 family protein n=1 Tax=Uliginosibacterium gangwonense TaxID=392736 RepID=UPI000377CB87|nr:TIGR02285 family protein [Uliginosibacterium gangwonense]
MKQVLAYLLLFTLPLFAWAADTIVWYHSDFPPISILSGPDKQTGAADQWEAYIRSRMPQFQHDLAEANTLRTLEEIKHRDNVCNPAMIKTPTREKNALFSDRIIDLLPNGLITLQSRLASIRPYMNENGELRLSELLASHKFRVGVASGRSFGTTIDSLLQAENARSFVVPFAASDIFLSGFTRMANRQSMDAVIGYAVELSFAARRIGRDPSQYVFLPIAEDTSLLAGHISCSRSPLGEKAIAQINEIIRTGGAEAALKAYRAWLPPEIRSYYDDQRKGVGKTHN